MTSFSSKTISLLFVFLCSIAISFATSSSNKTPNQNPEVISAALFKTQNKLNAIIENFDFDFKCNINSFELVKLSKHKDAISVVNKGEYFSPETTRIIQSAKAGDLYFFENIRARCQGDAASRKLAAFTVRIQ